MLIELMSIGKKLSNVNTEPFVVETWNCGESRTLAARSFRAVFGVGEAVSGFSCCCGRDVHRGAAAILERNIKNS
jgi:hypothetical protein